MKSIWCVQSGNGWCACKTNKIPGNDEVETLCGWSIMRHLGAKLGRPDCFECLEALRAKEQK